AARVHRVSFDERLPWLRGLHTPEEDSWFFRERMFRSCELWGEDRSGELIGIVAFRVGWIDQLYVLPGYHRQGVGSALLGIAKSKFPRIDLWTFQRNTGARAFYEAHDFVAIETTDGARNEEKEPDVLYRWIRGDSPSPERLRRSTSP